MARRQRCGWATREPLISYHDIEWGTPLHDDRRLFEFLVLEGMQAGLSWETVLKKRGAFRSAFGRFRVVGCAAQTASSSASSDVASVVSNVTHTRRWVAHQGRSRYSYAR